MLTEEVTVQEQVTERDGYGIAKQVWTDAMRLRASVKFNRGELVQDNFERVNTETVKVTTHLRKGIKRTMRVLYNGEKYSIKSVEHDRQGLMTILMCELINE